MELTLKNPLQPWLERVDALALRERLLLMAAGIVVLFLLVDTLWLRPTLKAQQLTEQRTAELESELHVLGQNSRLLIDPAEGDPVEARRLRRDQLRHQLAALDARLRDQLGALAEPAQAAQVLEQLLASHPGVKLVNLSATIEPLSKLEPDDQAGNAGLARYQLDMVLQGAYLDVLDYLRSLEQLSWKIFWEQVDFQSSTYPQAETRLKLYTLRVDHD